MILDFFFFNEIIITKNNIVTKCSWKTSSSRKKEKEKRKKKPNPRPDPRPEKPTRFFPGRVGFQTDKPDFCRVGFRVTVNPTRTDPISVLAKTMPDQGETMWFFGQREDYGFVRG